MVYSLSQLTCWNLQHIFSYSHSQIQNTQNHLALLSLLQFSAWIQDFYDVKLAKGLSWIIQSNLSFWDSLIRKKSLSTTSAYHLGHLSSNASVYILVLQLELFCKPLLALTGLRSKYCIRLKNYCRRGSIKRKKITATFME